MLEWLQEMIEKMGKHEAYIETSLGNQKEIFEKLHDIKTMLDQRTLMNVEVDKQITKITEIADSNSQNIQKLRLIVENGLSDRTKEIEKSVKLLEEAMEKRKQEKELEQARCEAGIGGFFKHSWDDFKTKFGWIIILIIIWLLTWGFVKSVIFHEYPFPKGFPSAAVVDVDKNRIPDSLEKETKEK
jgi:Fe2+ transport system protein B